MSWADTSTLFLTEARCFLKLSTAAWKAHLWLIWQDLKQTLSLPFQIQFQLKLFLPTSPLFQLSTLSNRHTQQWRVSSSFLLSSPENVGRQGSVLQILPPDLGTFLGVFGIHPLSKLDSTTFCVPLSCHTSSPSTMLSAHLKPLTSCSGPPEPAS